MFTFRSSLIGECWQNMKIMKAEFEQSESGDGLQSRKAGEERVRDEQASSRMDDEGCPNPPVNSPIRASANIRSRLQRNERRHTVRCHGEELGVLDPIHGAVMQLRVGLFSRQSCGFERTARLVRLCASRPR